VLNSLKREARQFFLRENLRTIRRCCKVPVALQAATMRAKESGRGKRRGGRNGNLQERLKEKTKADEHSHRDAASNWRATLGWGRSEQ